ncbi:hypothetical protein EMIHUDRAFT_245478 [Emiliania huxleyi CCMP1516]|uniref:Protein kinase domain-containing protein n=2 Tax=Emiliania huxleyi TaxID=2903 RepID=A0A0D3IX89_EMIH1|nr:hypothetical protein EMIHUDRAFT_245478 [Emiliania huxleyi CCMP1516]EOD15874.1 hypothetical protein EMIHUDRAFT_245478 [Emiliania huxleyi CCMP1516]|eukprot:XP_005768303.1 hypothetical protein EMIHUDRAFT_245478 [Emiliania huxleyi CCMP1516]
MAAARKVGEGGFGRVYRADALPSLPRVACGFAVKTALVGDMDPIIMQDNQASQLTDGYALGITLLVALTGRGAVGLLNACDDALEEPDTAESIAAADAGWSAAQAEELARLVVGLALACAPRVLERDTNCPACRQPAFPIAAVGAHVAAQTTFVHQPPARAGPAAARSPQPAGAHMHAYALHPFFAFAFRIRCLGGLVS